jgi:hypothetical protein
MSDETETPTQSHERVLSPASWTAILLVLAGIVVTIVGLFGSMGLLIVAAAVALAGIISYRIFQWLKGDRAASSRIERSTTTHRSGGGGSGGLFPFGGRGRGGGGSRSGGGSRGGRSWGSGGGSPRRPAAGGGRSSAPLRGAAVSSGARGNRRSGTGGSSTSPAAAHRRSGGVGGGAGRSAARPFAGSPRGKGGSSGSSAGRRSGLGGGGGSGRWSPLGFGGSGSRRGVGGSRGGGARRSSGVRGGFGGSGSGAIRPNSGGSLMGWGAGKRRSPNSPITHSVPRGRYRNRMIRLLGGRGSSYGGTSPSGQEVRYGWGAGKRRSPNGPVVYTEPVRGYWSEEGGRPPGRLRALAQRLFPMWRAEFGDQNDTISSTAPQQYNSAGNRRGWVSRTLIPVLPTQFNSSGGGKMSRNPCLDAVIESMDEAGLQFDPYNAKATREWYQWLGEFVESFRRMLQNQGHTLAEQFYLAPSVAESAYGISAVADQLEGPMRELGEAFEIAHAEDIARAIDDPQPFQDKWDISKQD